MNNFILIAIIITICLWFIVHMVDKAIINENIALREWISLKEQKEQALWNIMKHIQNQLKLTQLKECPIEELKQIPKEMIEWIDELEKETQEICQEVNET